MNKRITYSKEFKQEAVRQLEKGDKSAAELARELGVKRNQKTVADLFTLRLRDRVETAALLATLPCSYLAISRTLYQLQFFDPYCHGLHRYAEPAC